MQDRRTITARLAARIANEAAAGMTVELLAERHGLTAYVIERIVAHNAPGATPPPRPPRRRYTPRAASTRALDPADQARIARMLKAGATIMEICEETGLRKQIVRPLAVHALFDAGRRASTVARRLGITVRVARRLRAKRLFFGPKEALRPGERYVTRPTRCAVCDAPLLILPCRACCTREAAHGNAAESAATGHKYTSPPGRRTD